MQNNDAIALCREYIEKFEDQIVELDAALVEHHATPREEAVYVLGWYDKGVYHSTKHDWAIDVLRADRYRAREPYPIVRNGVGERARLVDFGTALEASKRGLEVSLQLLREQLAKLEG